MSPRKFIALGKLVFGDAIREEPLKVRRPGGEIL
jgi:hypothetical protein